MILTGLSIQAANGSTKTELKRPSDGLAIWVTEPVVMDTEFY
jgi:hypothetical protein